MGNWKGPYQGPWERLKVKAEKKTNLNLNLSLFPVYRFNTVFDKVLITSAEMLVSKESSGSRERRGVNRF